MNKRQQSILFAAILIGVISGCTALLSRIDPVYPDIKSRMQNLLRQAGEIKAVAAGNSHCKAIDFESLGQRGFHIWLGGNDAFETEHHLKTLIPRLPEVGTVYYAVSFHAFLADNRAATIFDRKAKRVEAYAYLPGWTWIPGDFDSFVKAKLINLIRPDHCYATVLRLLKQQPWPEPESDPFDGSRIGDRQFKGFRNIKVLIARAEKTRIVEHDNLVKNMLQNRPSLPEDTYACFERTIRFLQARGIRVVFFTPPYFFRYTELANRDMVETCRRNMRALSEKYNVEYYDFSADPEFVFETKYFMDEDHLNRRNGAPAFSKRLREKMDSR
ncbi:MAG: hypothetical protein AB7T27_00295 [Kiritimatiellia bacterium]